MKGGTALWAGMLACSGCSAENTARSPGDTALVVVPPAPPNEARGTSEHRSVTTRGIDDFWRRLASTLAAAGEPIRSFTHPDIGVFAMWPYGETRVIARFDDLEELRTSDIVPELSGLRAEPLPPRLTQATARCGGPPGDALLVSAHGTTLDDLYRAMRSTGLLPDDSTEDQQLAEKADQVIRYSVHVRARRLSFFLGQLEGRWYLLAVSVGNDCDRNHIND